MSVCRPASALPQSTRHTFARGCNAVSQLLSEGCPPVTNARGTLPPGSPAPRRGKYVAVGPRGGKTDQTATMKSRGDNLPPTDRSGQKWKPA